MFKKISYTVEVQMQTSNWT